MDVGVEPDSKGAVEDVDVVQDEEMLKSIPHPLCDVLPVTGAAQRHVSP